MLNTSNEPKVRWTAEEKAYLIAHYAKDGAEKVANHLNRSRSSVSIMAHYLNTTTREKRGTILTEKEISYIKNHIDFDSIPQIAKKLKRSAPTIRRYAQMEKLGIYAKDEFCCNPPDSCFVCPYDDCICCRYTNTPKEAEFLRIGMERTVGEGAVVRKRV